MRVVKQMTADVRNFFVNIPFYAPTSRRVKLGQVADFHVCVMLSEVEAFLFVDCLCERGS
jgi:hypothetical protein